MTPPPFLCRTLYPYDWYRSRLYEERSYRRARDALIEIDPSMSCYRDTDLKWASAKLGLADLSVSIAWLAAAALLLSTLGTRDWADVPATLIAILCFGPMLGRLATAAYHLYRGVHVRHDWIRALEMVQTAGIDHFRDSAKTLFSNDLDVNEKDARRVVKNLRSRIRSSTIRNPA